MRLTPIARRGAADRLVALADRVFGQPLPVRLRCWDGSEAGPDDAPVVLLRSRRALRRLCWQPSELGLAEAYIAGELDVDGDLEAALSQLLPWARTLDPSAGRPGPAGRVGALATAAGLGGLGPRPPAPGQQARLFGRPHSAARDRAAIAHHYDLSNSFYEVLLDPAMAYSCGYWTSTGPGYTLERAQRDKLDLVCAKLGLRRGMRLLDVGCGWGSLLIHAARHYGVHATGVTLSAGQREFVAARVTELGLEHAVEVREQDYRSLGDGPYDAVASIEMGEHVGRANYPCYAATLARMVRDQGRVLIQQMARRDAPGGGAFIEHYIAPDMAMTPVGTTVNELERAGLEVCEVQALREHYPPTIRAWAQTLERHWHEAVELLGTAGARVWRLYLAGGALAFEQNRMGVNQILAVRPGACGQPGRHEVTGSVVSAAANHAGSNLVTLDGHRVR